jgi:K+-sensing histidine kinase KdpD
LGASLLLQHFHLRDAGVPLLLFAVAISSWYGGTGPAALAVILSMISFYWYFVDPVTGVEDQDVRTPTARPGPGIHSKAIVALVKKAPERAGPDEF